MLLHYPVSGLYSQVIKSDCYFTTRGGLLPMSGVILSLYWICCKNMCPSTNLHTQSLPCRLVPKHRLISIPKTCVSLKINISLHNWTSKKICSIRYTQYVHISFWTLRKWLYKRRKNGRRSRPPSAADFLCCFEVLNTVISWKSKIKSTHIEYI